MRNLSRTVKRLTVNFLGVLCVIAYFQPFTITADAKETSVGVNGSIYEFARNAHYEFSSVSASGTTSSNTFGTCTILGEIKDDGTKDGIPAYIISSESISFYYSCDSSRLEVAETEWHLIEDKSKKIDTISLEKNILSGAIVVQSSKDGENWITDVAMTDTFAADSDLSATLYTTKGIQLENGCYYRIIVAYALQRKTGESQILFVTTDEIEEKKIAEVYEFYAISGEVAGTTTTAATTPRRILGQTVNTGKDNGYSGNNTIDKDDPHYGWKLGTFVVNGYTRETTSEGTPVFLKNVNDKVTLWFVLTQDISKLNGDSALSISEDINGYDQEFQIAQTNFKHGTLLIRYTDHEGNAHDPVIYTDFLAANSMTGADTRVQLFEEGDYEVSLDYEIENNPRRVGPMSVLPTHTNYKISFSFSIRNGNCMVYPLDIATGRELFGNTAPSGGFRLDMAKSRYLTVDVKKTILTVGKDGLLTEDVRFNRPAKDNDSYTEEGIYTFTVKNLYTGESTTKTIYVGTNKYLLALSNNSMTIEALNEKIAQGAIISDDGTIADYVPDPETEPPIKEEAEPDSIATENVPAAIATESPEGEMPDPIVDVVMGDRPPVQPIAAVAGTVIVVVLAVCLLVNRRKKMKTEADL